MADLTVTASQVQPGTTDAQTALGVAGGTITAGEAVYLDTTVGQYKAAKSDATATASVAGIALNGASSGQPLQIQIGGTVTIGAGAAPTVGVIYVLSAATAGGIAPSTDLASTNRVSVLGVGAATNTIILKIHNSGQVKP